MICLHARRKSLKIGYWTSLPFTENPHIERKQGRMKWRKFREAIYGMYPYCYVTGNSG